MTTKTIKEALKDAREALKGHVPSGALDARVLLQRLLEVNPSYLLLHEEEQLTESATVQYEGWIEKRKEGMPVAYIVGTKEFMGLSFKVTKDTLIPRP
ncbi:MAG TPA: protein-(glutamine-N5) methyltransferase, release factor-specific, partial [Clostridiaceae bacterium]|nr:protein-(glutamine-N5) methyltransferase, release factor-specific [Clostridiaceae bacterium]